MRVLILSTIDPLSDTSEARWINNITERLNKQGFEFDLITSGRGSGSAGQETSGVITVYRTEKSSFDIKAVAEHARNLHAHNPYTHAWAIGMDAGRALDTFVKNVSAPPRTVLTLAGEEKVSQEKSFLQKLSPVSGSTFPQVDVVTVPSSEKKLELTQEGITTPMSVIPEGVDLTHFTGALSEAALERKRERFGITDTTNAVLAVSPLTEEKGITDLVNAFEFLPQNTKLLIIGSGPEEYALKNALRAKNFEDRVFALGAVPYEEMPHYYALADIFVRPSKKEHDARAFLEALASRVPIVGTETGALLDILRDGETGVFVEAGDPRSIASGINKLFKSVALREAMGEKGRALVESEYSLSAVAAQFAQLFQRGEKTA